MIPQEIRPLLKGAHGPEDKFTALCPAHDDRTPSLSVSLGDNGGILLKCHARCPTDKIVAAMGLTMKDLFPDKPQAPAKPKHPNGEKPEAEYIYTDESGKVVHKTIRNGKQWANPFSQARPDPNKPGRWIHSLKGIETVLYRLPEVCKAVADNVPVFICEGEKDCDNLVNLGFIATTSPMGAGKWKESYNKYLAGADVYLIPDNDEPGRKHADAVGRSLSGVAESVRVIDLLAADPSLPEHGDITDYLKRNVKTTSKAREAVAALIEAAGTFEAFESESEWPEIVPFDTIDTPPFPVDALPSATREFIYCAAETVQAPVEMIGSCVLGALAVACGGRYPVCLPNGHTERPCLYIAPIAPPSERKSGVVDVITRPLIEYEIEYNQAHGGEVAQNKSELKLLQGKIAAAEQTAIKAKKSEDRLIAEHELKDLNNELAEFETVEPMRLFGADVTPEKLASMLKAQGGTFALISAEGGGLFENIGRYSDKGGLEIYLNGYSGDRVCVDRKNSESIVLDRPTLNIIAPCQPSVISDLFSDRQKAGRGLLSRILFVKCQSRVGGRKATGKPLDDRTRANYRNLCLGMLSATSAGALTYDNDGFDVYCQFFDEIEPQLTPDVGELSFMGDWAGKLPGNMTRFAGLIHCISAFEQSKDPLDTPINAEEARAAVELARFYLAHAKTVYSEQAEPESIRNARYLWERINSLNSLSFSKGELTRKVQNKVDFDYTESLQRLIDYGYIRVEVVVTGRGRPSERICVNPKAVKKSEKSEINPGRDNKFTLFTQNPSIPNIDFAGLAQRHSRIIPNPPPTEGRVSFTI